jgi:hypothetical protein
MKVEYEQIRCFRSTYVSTCMGSHEGCCNLAGKEFTTCSSTVEKLSAVASVESRKAWAGRYISRVEHATR